MDMLNTRKILKRKHYQIEGNNYNCVIHGEQREETTFYYLFFSCPFKSVGHTSLFDAISMLIFIPCWIKQN